MPAARPARRRQPRRRAVVDRLRGSRKLLLGELRDYVTEFQTVVAGPDTGAGRLVEGFVASLRAARGNRLVSGLLAADPETAVPMLTTLTGHPADHRGVVKETPSSMPSTVNAG